MKLHIIALLTFISATSFADPIGGTRTAKGLVRPGEVDVYSIPLRANELTRFVAQGDGDGDIDCFAYDDNGNLIGQDSDSTDTCLIDIRSFWSATFKFVIKNNGSSTDSYFMKAY